MCNCASEVWSFGPSRNDEGLRNSFSAAVFSPWAGCLGRKAMPKISLLPRVLAASLAVMSVVGSVAWAQQPPPVRIRGTIAAVDGSLLTGKSREGTALNVRLTHNVAVFGVAHIPMSQTTAASSLP